MLTTPSQCAQVKIDGTSVEWDELHFDVRLLQRVPYEGVSRMQTSVRRPTTMLWMRGFCPLPANTLPPRSFAAATAIVSSGAFFATSLQPPLHHLLSAPRSPIAPLCSQSWHRHGAWQQPIDERRPLHRARPFSRAARPQMIESDFYTTPAGREHFRDQLQVSTPLPPFHSVARASDILASLRDRVSGTAFRR